MDYRKNNQIDPWDDRVFGTGRTEPPKNNSVVIALLLIIVIFLSGIVSVLSFLNVKLFQQLQAQNQVNSIPMAFSDIEETAVNPTERNSLPEFQPDEDAIEIPILGLTGNHITQFDQYYFRWPAGVLITQVEEGSKAESVGIEPGDILISINDTQITSQETLDVLLSSDPLGDTLQIVIHRDGKQYSLTITQ